MKALILSAAALLTAGAAYAQVPATYVLSSEADNAQVEEKFFPQIAAFRQVDERNVRTGQAAIRLRAQPLPAVLSSALLPVRAGQQVTIEAYAHYASILIVTVMFLNSFTTKNLIPGLSPLISPPLPVRQCRLP